MPGGASSANVARTAENHGPSGSAPEARSSSG